MNREQGSFLRVLRQRHRLLWLLLGVGLALFLCSKLVQNGAIAIGLLVGLLFAYGCAGEWAARLVARLVRQSARTRPAVALFSCSAAVGAFLAVLSLLLHLVLLVVLDRCGVLVLQSSLRESMLLRAAALPLLACLGAACVVSGTALMESTNVPPGRALSDWISPLCNQQPENGPLPPAGLDPSSSPHPLHQGKNRTGPSHRATDAGGRKRRKSGL